MEALILAGGRGTRLASELPANVPKPLAPVAGRPFIFWLLEQLTQQGVSRAIISVGWLAEAVAATLGHSFGRLQLAYCSEQSPLGTGGAMKAALRTANEQQVFVLNGDSFVDLNFGEMQAKHSLGGRPISIACVSVEDTSRYGRIEITNGTVTGFTEKGQTGPGVINAGVYLVDRDILADFPRDVFSFEQDFLAANVGSLSPCAHVLAGLFIDIGVPADLTRAQNLFPIRRHQHASTRAIS
jgi:D-glycero-alpha-D-manno-heptose 1-phosphate guanylyltransferase